MMMDEDGDECVVKVRGLPWSATKEDILEFFGGECRVAGGLDGVHLITTPEGRNSGEAFLLPASDIHSFTLKDKGTMGHRYIEVFRAKRAEMDWFLKRSRPHQPGPPRMDGGYSEDCEAYLRLRGLPFECTKEDIMDFFKGMEIVPNGIQLMVDSYGRSSGESYVQFSSPQEAERAFKTKDKQSIGHRYVEIFRVGPAEMRSIQMLVSRPTGRPAYNQRPTPYDRGGRGDRDSGMAGSRYGGPPPPRPARYFSKGFEDDSWNSYGNDGGWNNRGPPPFARGGRGGGGRGGSRGGGYGGVPPPPPPPGGPGGPGRSGHCVLMRGLPFKASEDNIREFFEPLVPTAVHIIFESSGRPSGTAKVEFASGVDVTRAMAKHKERMEHRYIELFVHSVN